jgi:dipeptide transport system ATP-binding protein
MSPGEQAASHNPPLADAPVAVARDLSVHYKISRGLFTEPATLRAVDGVSFSLAVGRTLAVVGESGCGKSTLARVVTLIERPTSGFLALDDRDVTNATPEQLRRSRPTVQMVFQDPYGSLNPRQRVGAILEEPLRANTPMEAAERAEAARDMLRRVGLRPEHYGRYPHMFSGGQRQRIAIARALMLRPRLVVADEPVSALDVSIQAQVLNLLMDLQEEFRLAYLFISHDLGVVRHIADEIMVMYLGRVTEQGPRDAIFAAPRHPYTIALLASTPRPEPDAKRREIRIRGEMPSPLAPPPGCSFSSRCPFVTDRCRAERPELRPVDDRVVACHHAESLPTA